MNAQSEKVQMDAWKKEWKTKTRFQKIVWIVKELVNIKKDFN